MHSVYDEHVGDRRFGPDFVEEDRRGYGRRPPEQRQLTYDIAVNDDCAAWRLWLDEQLASLSPKIADGLARKGHAGKCTPDVLVSLGSAGRLHVYLSGRH